VSDTFAKFKLYHEVGDEDYIGYVSAPVDKIVIVLERVYRYFAATQTISLELRCDRVLPEIPTYQTRRPWITCAPVIQVVGDWPHGHRTALGSKTRDYLEFTYHLPRSQSMMLDSPPEYWSRERQVHLESLLSGWASQIQGPEDPEEVSVQLWMDLLEAIPWME
jgi:hypothetical protein